MTDDIKKTADKIMTRIKNSAKNSYDKHYSIIDTNNLTSGTIIEAVLNKILNDKNIPEHILRNNYAKMFNNLVDYHKHLKCIMEIIKQNLLIYTVAL